MSEKSNSNKSEPAAVLQRPDEILKETYAKGGFGSPDRIGRVMQTIRERRPLTESEWRAWYLANVRSETELLNLAGEMFREIPRDAPVTMRQTLDFIENMIFSVSFRGYDKSNLALQFLKSVLNPPGADAVCAAPLDWREKYDIDFYAAMAGSLLGIRLRPADEDKPSREGEWAEEKRKAFSEKYGEDKAETLLYVRTPEGYAPDPRQKELWLKLRRLICINRLKKLGKLEERIPPDFDKLQDEILARGPEGLLSLPCRTQGRHPRHLLVYLRHPGGGGEREEKDRLRPFRLHRRSLRRRHAAQRRRHRGPARKTAPASRQLRRVHLPAQGALRIGLHGQQNEQPPLGIRREAHVRQLSEGDLLHQAKGRGAARTLFFFAHTLTNPALDRTLL